MSESLNEKMLRAALMGALKNVVFEVNDQERAELLVAALEQYRATKSKSFEVESPDGDHVATVSLNKGKPETVVSDSGGLLEWCRVNRPDLVVEVVHAPVEGWTETVVKPTAAAVIAEDYKLAGDVYVTEDGVPVDGVEYRLPGEPSKFTLSYVAKDRGLSLVQAWRDGLLPIGLGSRLPQIGAGS